MVFVCILFLFIYYFFLRRHRYKTRSTVTPRLFQHQLTSRRPFLRGQDETPVPEWGSFDKEVSQNYFHSLPLHHKKRGYTLCCRDRSVLLAKIGIYARQTCVSCFRSPAYDPPHCHLLDKKILSPQFFKNFSWKIFEDMLNACYIH